MTTGADADMETPRECQPRGRLSPGSRNCRTVPASTVDVSQPQRADCAGSRNQPPAGGVEDEPGWVSIGSSAQDGVQEARLDEHVGSPCVDSFMERINGANIVRLHEAHAR